MSDSTITKQAIAKGLKNSMLLKSFDKITISDITKECGLNRQTFYYHFQDKYELLNWIFYNEVIEVFTRDLSLDNWQDNLYAMLHVMECDRTFYQNAIRQSFQDEFTDYLVEISTALFGTIIDNIAGIDQANESNRKVLSEFFAFGVVGLILAWAKGGMKLSALHIKTQITDIINNSRAFATKRLQEDGHIL